MLRGKLINAMAALIVMSLNALPDGEALAVLSVAKQAVKNQRKEAERIAQSGLSVQEVH